MLRRCIFVVCFVWLSLGRVAVEGCFEYKLVRSTKHHRYDIYGDYDISSELVKRCCDGWVETEDGACIESCGPDCPAKKCTRGGLCLCSSGLVWDVSRKKCVERSNSCVHCLPGDICFSDPVCENFCEESCANGYCADRHTCECDDGYEWNEELQKCEAHCTSECVNGSCTGPDVCTCNEGYAWAGKNVCRPFCVTGCSGQGECVGPEKCECNPGFLLSGVPGDRSDCIPECVGKCKLHSFCSAFTGKCTCDQGYTMQANGSCVPKCSQCVNGLCVRPEDCMCLPGFVNRNSSFCEPRCGHNCVNGFCDLNNKCNCLLGYTKSADAPNVCVPNCDPPCANATCTFNNRCRCQDGYRSHPDPKQSHVCLDLCEVGCKNGTCQDHKCACPTGTYFSEVSLNCEACQPGTWCNGKFVPPVCDPPCVNGNCTVYNECECLAGYDSQKGSNVCEPVCDPPCENGRCSANRVCECLPGYKKLGKKHACHAVCEKHCVNGFCGAPNTCHCYHGYEFANAEQTVCKPNCAAADPCVCAPEHFETLTDPLYANCTSECFVNCGTGECLPPNGCKCDERHVFDRDLRTCVELEKIVLRHHAARGHHSLKIFSIAFTSLVFVSLLGFIAYRVWDTRYKRGETFTIITNRLFNRQFGRVVQEDN